MRVRVQRMKGRGGAQASDTVLGDFHAGRYWLGVNHMLVSVITSNYARGCRCKWMQRAGLGGASDTVLGDFHASRYWLGVNHMLVSVITSMPCHPLDACSR